LTPDLWIVVADPFRPTAQASYYPGDVNFTRAAIIVVNKANTAPQVCWLWGRS
jgi:predicted GTPase